MVFLTQDGKQLVEVKSVKVIHDDEGYCLFGYESHLTIPVKLGVFDSEEKAKLVLLRLATSNEKQTPKK
jgi:hypothetical protein